MRHPLISALMLPVVAVLISGTAAHPDDDPLARLGADDHEVVKEAVRDILARRTELVQQLIGMIDDDEDWSQRARQAKAAAFLLGEMRAVEAVPVLVRFIDREDRLPFFRPSDARRSDLAMLPAAAALVSIGEPSIPALMDRLRSVERHGIVAPPAEHLLRVLVELEGVEAAAARILRATLEEEDPAARRSLLAVLRHLLQYSAMYRGARDAAPLNR